VVRRLTNIHTATPSDTEISIDSDSQHLYTWGGQAGSVIDFVANFATVTEYEIFGVLNSTALLGHSVSADITDIDTNATVLSVSVPNDLGSLTGTLQPGNYRILIQNRSHARGPYLWAGSIPYGPLNVNQDGNGTLHLGLIAAPLVKEVNIDVKPGSDKNPVNLKSQGVLPVAILSSADFDATQVNTATVTLGDPIVIDAGGQAILASKSSIEDVDGDGLLDIVLFFDSAQLAYYAIDENSTAVELQGQTLNEDAIHGEDGISIVAGSTKGKK
jgi:hypothetical protein